MFILLNLVVINSLHLHPHAVKDIMNMKIEHMAMKSHLWTTNPQEISKVSVQPKPYIGMRFMNGHENSCSKWVDLFVTPLTMLSISQTTLSQKWMIITTK